MTRTDIANLALSKLGAEPITDLATDATKEAVHCRIWYDQVLREVLRSHFWSFAMGVTQIGKVFAVEASATLTLGNADDDTEITFTAVTPGIAGNEISWQSAVPERRWAWRWTRPQSKSRRRCRPSSRAHLLPTDQRPTCSAQCQ